MSTEVKHIRNTQRGAPVINGTPGTLIAALDALFVSGWGPTNSISVSVSSGVATATLNSGETFDRDSVVLIAGATPSALNGEARVLTTSSTSITWATSAPDGPATGTISILYAPQTAWQKVYAGTNRAAYRSNHVQGNGAFLSVVDTGTTTARARGFESMTNVDTGVGPFPTDAQMSGGGHFWKSQSANANPVEYAIFCDRRFVILAIAAGSAANGPSFRATGPVGFGDPISLSPSGDAFGTLLAAGGSTVAAVSNSSLVSNIDGSSLGLIACARSITGLGSSVQVNPRAFIASNNSTSGADAYLGGLPSVVDGQVKFSRMFVRQVGLNTPPRSIVPGVLYIPQDNSDAALKAGDTLLGSVEMLGRRLLVMHGASGQYNQTSNNVYLVDLTGPWR